MCVFLQLWLNDSLLNWNVIFRHCTGFWGQLQSFVLRQLEPLPPRPHWDSLTSMSGRICFYLRIYFVVIILKSWILGALLSPWRHCLVLFISILYLNISSNSYGVLTCQYDRNDSLSFLKVVNLRTILFYHSFYLCLLAHWLFFSIWL